jgi:phage gpG-like protein
MKETLVGRPMQIEEYGRKSARFGTRDQKAVWQHFGTEYHGRPHIPARPIIVLTDDDRHEIANIVARYVNRHRRAGGL